MKLATTTGDFAAYAENQAESIQWIANAGFRYLDYNFAIDSKRKVGVFGADYNGYIKELKKQSERFGIRFVQAHAPTGKPLMGGGEELIEKTNLCIKACAELGISCLVVHSGYAPNLTKQETIEKNKAFYLPILETAERYGINILTENFNRMTPNGIYWIDNAKDLLQLIEYVDHPLFEAVWDTGHANLLDIPQDESLRLLGKHIKALHVQDNLGDDDTHLAPYFGTMNLDCLMHGLSEIGYNGYFTFESVFFVSQGRRRIYEKDTRALSVPLSVQCKAEELLYEIGRSLLRSYDRFEE